MGRPGPCRLFLASGRGSRRYWGPTDRSSGRPTLMAATPWRSAPATRQAQPIRPPHRGGSRPARLAASPGWRRRRTARTVAVAAQDGRLRVVDVESGQVREIAASDNGVVTGLAWSPDSAWLAWSQPAEHPARQQPQPAPPAAAGADRRRPGFRRHRRAVRRHRAGLHPRRQVPGVLVDARLRSDLRRALLRPDVPVRGQALPAAPRRDDSVTLRTRTRRAAHRRARGTNARRPRRLATNRRVLAARRVARRGSRGRGDRPRVPPVPVETTGMADRIVALPVPEARYSRLRAVKDGLAWLREPVTGNLGLGGAQPDDAPRPTLERFDLARREVCELAGEVDWFEASGDGTKLVTSDHGKLTVIPAERRADDRQSRRQDRDRPEPGQVHARSARDVASGLRRGGPHHAARLLGARHGGRGLGRRTGRIPAAARPDHHRVRIRRCALGGFRRARHVACLRPRAGRRHASRRARAARRGHRAQRRRLAADPGGARGHLRSPGPRTAGGARRRNRRRRRAARRGWPAGRA